MYECKKVFKHHLILEKNFKKLIKKGFEKKMKKLPVTPVDFHPDFFYCKLDQFYFIRTKSNNFFHIIKKDAILERCIIIKNDNEEIYLTSLVDHQNN